MAPNPYEPPKEPSERWRKPSPKTVIVLTVWFLAAIPGACVCGGITCHSVGLMGEALAKAGGYEQDPFWREIGWLIGIPIAFLVTSFLIALAARTLCKRVTVPRK